METSTPLPMSPVFCANNKLCVGGGGGYEQVEEAHRKVSYHQVSATERSVFPVFQTIST